MREVRTEPNSRVQTSIILIGTKGYSARMPINKKKFEKGLNLSELSDAESLDGSPTDSETKKQAIKPRETRLTRKQSVPQRSHQFCFMINS